MKFNKITLDESLFDDTLLEAESTIDWEPAENILEKGTTNLVTTFSYDDDFSAPEYMPDMEDHIDAPEGPKSGSDTGVADILISSIEDELETIRKYNSLVATLRVESANNPQYNTFIDVINEINNEENKHVGQLQELLKVISPNAESIDQGQLEGEAQLKFTNGLLQVQSWDTPASSSNINQIEDMCTLSDVDDEM